MIIKDEFPLNGTFVTSDGEVFNICTMEIDQGLDELNSLVQDDEAIKLSDEEDYLFYERMISDEENYFN